MILTGRIPEIVDAFRLEACGRLASLKPTKLRGIIDVDPRNEDFFRKVIELRKSVALLEISETEKKRLEKFLKVLANSTSYGIYAEMNRRESDKETRLRCHGIDPEPFFPKVINPEEPGQYCFPPMASLITGGARLMLALLEYSVTSLGGTYAMEDTDSMAIVATEKGGLVPCKGGPYCMKDGREAVKALSRKQVQGISDKFRSLNPYDPKAVPGSILKIEDDNFDPETKKQRQIYCYAISAKHYDLFVRDENGNPVLLRKGVNSKDSHWSEHGLGHLLNPTDPESDDREWIPQIWERLIKESEGIKTKRLKFENIPAVGRITVSSPSILEPLTFLNRNKKYSDQIKPFNFLLSCHIAQLGYPVGVDPTKFHLIAPYSTNPGKWLNREWLDQYSGQKYQVSTGNYQSRKTARVKTYGDVIGEYKFHPESKCADSEGNICGKQTTGLLFRRHIKIDQIKYIGKESNNLEEVDAGIVHSEQNVYTEYPDPRRGDWETKVRPAMLKISISTLKDKTQLSERTLKYARSGKRRPRLRHQTLIKIALKKEGLL